MDILSFLLQPQMMMIFGVAVPAGVSVGTGLRMFFRDNYARLSYRATLGLLSALLALMLTVLGVVALYLLVMVGSGVPVDVFYP